jgi:hypothetical protein
MRRPHEAQFQDMVPEVDSPPHSSANFLMSAPSPGNTLGLSQIK